jgi:predicted metal-dependent hydrolase
MISLLGSLNALRQAKPLEPKIIEVSGRDVALNFRRNARCRRMVLRLTADGQSVVMTLPHRTSLAEALRFAETSKPWIEKTMAKRPPAVSFENDTKILFQGEHCTIRAVGGRRGLVMFSQEELSIIVPGDAAHVPRRLTDWLKAQAKAELQSVSQNYATAMQVKFKKLTVRDQKSRWGSCSATGDLSYSWRLILAPPEVLDYVAAHEVAHLKEMNHGPKFWRLVVTHCKTAKQARRWLRENGRELHRYGAG